jgi:carbamoylphosphate synthase small subunit
VRCAAVWPLPRQVKLPFGNRGQNQPVKNVITGECYITPQNHGYAIGEWACPLMHRSQQQCVASGKLCRHNMLQRLQPWYW